jgi:hypothetical protein
MASRIKPTGVAFIVIVAAVAIFIALYSTGIVKHGKSSSKDTTSVSSTIESNGDQAPTDNAAASTTDHIFSYVAPKPQNGILNGVVEVGASGFNSFTILRDDEGRWEIKTKDFGQSLAYEGMASTEDIRFGLKKYLAIMFEKGVNKSNMHFVVSSGAQKSEQTMKVVGELKKMGYFVNLVTSDQEGKLALHATVPPSYQSKSFMIDIGSGNTKISWEEGMSLKSVELPGAKYYEKGLTDEQVYAQVKEAASQVPQALRETAFIIGGVPYAIAKDDGADTRRYTVLGDPSSYKAGDNRKKQAGLNIYKAIKDATGTKQFVFDVDANFTIGFLLGLKHN